MSTTYNYIPTLSVAVTGTIEEMEGSPVLNFAQDNAGATRTFKMAESDLSSFVASLLPNCQATGTVMQITKPAQLTNVAGMVGLFSEKVRAKTVTIRPFGKTTAGTQSQSEKPASSDHWIAEVQYGYSPAIEEEFLPGAEFMTMSPTAFKWSSDNAPLLNNEAPGRMITKGMWNVTRHWLPVVPDEYLDLIGTCNETAVLSQRYQIEFDPETLLYMPPCIRSYYSATGLVMHSVTARMIYKKDATAATWNKFYRAKTNSYDSIKKIAGGASADPYLTAAFAPIANYSLTDV